MKENTLILELSPTEAKALLNLLDAAISCFAGCAGGVLHPLHERLSEEDRKRYPDHEDDIEKVLKWFDTLSYPKQDNVVECLDETIHKLYGNLASAVNNAGVEAQLKFIFQQCGEKAWDELGRALDEWEFK